jgi:type III restriction enzyme
MTRFLEEIITWEDYVEPSTEKAGVGGTHLYDGVIFGSEGIEKPFIQDLEKRRDVRLYIKLPDWFKVPTPIGNYEPDWAIVMDNPEDGDPVLYLVRETKGTLDLGKLRPDEERKIKCGRQHFDALGVNFRVVTSASELPNGGV